MLLLDVVSVYQFVRKHFCYCKAALLVPWWAWFKGLIGGQTYSVSVSTWKRGVCPMAWSFHFIFCYVVLIKIYLDNPYLHRWKDLVLLIQMVFLIFVESFFLRRSFFSKNVLNSVHRALWAPSCFWSWDSKYFQLRHHESSPIGKSPLLRNQYLHLTSKWLVTQLREDMMFFC